MDKTTRDMVRQRAGNRCEYCGLRQEHYGPWRHQFEHIVPKKHGGTDEEANLALACMRCNLCRSSNLSGIDSDTGNVETLFNPRSQHWHEHFRLTADRVVGLTPTGRATVSVLNMNDPERLRLRGELLENGELDSAPKTQRSIRCGKGARDVPEPISIASSNEVPDTFSPFGCRRGCGLQSHATD